MSVIFFLIAIGVLVAGGFLIAFIWSVRSGQYDDDYTPAVRMLFDNYKPDEEPSQEPLPEKEKDKTENIPEQSNNNKS
ncbi:MAG: cbb3-type cytochrome oxidase assembly protein CcoS [Bacteroidales bacterium]